MNTNYRSPDLHALFEQFGTRKTYTRGQTIGSSDEPGLIVCMENGFIKRYMIRNEGTLDVQIVYGPQDVFSLTQVYGELLGQSLYDGNEQFFYHTLTDVELLHLRPNALREAVADNPLLYRDLFSEAGYHLHTCVSRMESMSFHTTAQRAAHLLLYYAKKFGEPAANGVAIQFPLTHQTLAEVLDTTRETVTRAMIELRKQGLITTGRHIVVRDVVRLSEAGYE